MQRRRRRRRREGIWSSCWRSACSGALLQLLPMQLEEQPAVPAAPARLRACEGSRGLQGKQGCGRRRRRRRCRATLEKLALCACWLWRRRGRRMVPPSLLLERQRATLGAEVAPSAQQQLQLSCALRAPWTFLQQTPATAQWMTLP
jgi:hypothetical protein